MSSPTSTSRRLTALLALVSLGLVGFFAAFPGTMGSVGIGTGGIWFRDLLAVLTAIDAQRHGIDPYTLAFGQHNYTEWWFRLTPPGIGPGDVWWLGGTLVGATLVVAWGLARPRRAADVGWFLLVLASPGLVLALNRANVDLGLFVLLALAVPAVLARARLWRIVGAVLIIALGLGLKYYPAFAALILLAIRPAADRRAAGWLALALFGLTIVSVLPELLRFRGVVNEEGFYVFGAPAAFRKLGLPGGLGPLVGSLGLLLAGMVLSRRDPLRSWTPDANERAAYLRFILGAAVLTGCFLFTVNYAYRWVFALFLIPFLNQPEPAAPRLAAFKSVTRTLLLLQLWLEPGVVLWLNYRPQTLEGLRAWTHGATTALTFVTWSLFACLAGWLAHFVVRHWRADVSAAPPGSSPATSPTGTSC
jgi:hypothetical protein